MSYCSSCGDIIDALQYEKYDSPTKCSECKDKNKIKRDLRIVLAYIHKREAEHG